MKEKDEKIIPGGRSIDISGLNYSVSVSSTHGETLKQLADIALTSIQCLKSIETNGKE